MSILTSIKQQLSIKPTAEEFYHGCQIEKVEWWLSSCHEFPDLFWARLRTFSNGKADVLFQDENKTYGFDNEDYAGYFISEDEFSKFHGNFDENRDFIEVPREIEIQIPVWTNREVKIFEYIGTY